MSTATHASRRVVLDRCPLCSAASWTSLTDAGVGGYEWVRCSCTAVFKHSEPLGEPANSSALGHGDEAYFARYAQRRRRRIAKSRRQILDALEVAPQGRLLDVGCSLGYTLEAARSLGLDAAGADLSAHAIEQCRRLGFEAYSGTLFSLPFADNSFAVAVLKHVFEHTPEPRRALAELRRVLVPGAAVFFAVPNAGYFKATRTPARSRFFRGEAGRAHFICYSPATLARLLEGEGFRVASVHACLVHRRAGGWRTLLETLALPLRVPCRAAIDTLGLRKEFWLVAVRT